MKQTIFTLVLSIAFLSMNAASFKIPEYTSKGSDYVLTDTSIQYFETIRKGFSDKLIAKNNGDKTVFNMDNVREFKVDGKVYVKRYIVIEGTNEVQEVFMQKICTCSGYTLYKKIKSANEDLNITDFFVYQNETQMHQLNEENYKVILSFFFSKFNEMFA
jgi:hypothetical protein